ncbi:hypothetical protein [Flavobacterium piscinae]|uniref:hypothetical protein n=1 Tax=Flavobacterium piscinae TaxID=2506424 RepID=UPI002AAC03ED|nr:hypothetical protein [Flavobacterium piscinae]
MFNNGMLSKQIRYSAICLHLDHKRSYATQESIAKNKAIRSFNKKIKLHGFLMEFIKSISLKSSIFNEKINPYFCINYCNTQT